MRRLLFTVLHSFCPELKFPCVHTVCRWAPWLDCVNKSQLDAASLIKAEAHIAKAIAASQLAIAEARRALAAAKAAAEAERHGDVGPAAREAAAAAMAAAKAANDAAVSSAEVTAAAAAAATGGRNSWVMCKVDLPSTRANMLIFEILVCSLSPAVSFNCQRYTSILNCSKPVS